MNDTKANTDSNRSDLRSCTRRLTRAIVRNRYVRNRWTYRLILLLLIVAGYRMLLEVVPRLVETRPIRAELRDWAEGQLQYKAAVELGNMDLAMKFNGDSLLYVHDVRIDAPNPAALQPCLDVDRLRLRTPLYTLGGIFAAVPELELREAQLRIEWDAAGQFNLAGLIEPVAEPVNATLPPFFGVRARQMRMLLRDCEVIVNDSRRHLRLDIPLGGEFIMDLRDGRLFGSIAETVFSCRGLCVGDDDTPKCHGRVTDLRVRLRPATGGWPLRLERIAGETRDLPLQMVGFFMSGCPEPPSSARFSGAFAFSPGAWRCKGMLSGAPVPQFGLPATYAIELSRSMSDEDSGGGNKGVRFKVRARNGQRDLLLLETAPEADGEFGELRGWCAALNLDHAAIREPGCDWLLSLLRRFPRLRLNIGEMRLANLRIRNANAVVTPRASSCVDVDLEGSFAGGEVVVAAQMLPMSETGRRGEPPTYTVEMTVPDITKMPKALRRLLPSALHCTPVAGDGTIRISSGFNEEMAASAWSLAVELRDLSVETDGAGLVLRELARLPMAMTKVENLRRRSLNALRTETPLPEVAVPQTRLSVLTFRTLTVRIGNGSDGEPLCRLSAVSPEFGLIEGEGRREGEGYRLTLALRQTPSALFKDNPTLSEETRRAILRTSRTRGLRFDFFFGDAGETSRARFVQDVFNAWVEAQARAEGTSG